MLPALVTFHHEMKSDFPSQPENTEKWKSVFSICLAVIGQYIGKQNKSKTMSILNFLKGWQSLQNSIGHN